MGKNFYVTDFDFSRGTPSPYGANTPARPAQAKCGGGAVKLAQGGQAAPLRGRGIPMDADPVVPPSKLIPTPTPRPGPRGITGSLKDISEIKRGPGSKVAVRHGKHLEVFPNIDAAMHPSPDMEGPTTEYHRDRDGSTESDYAKGGFIKKAVHRPGRLKAMAARKGISTLQAAEEASHSPDPSLRAAGNLGKRFIKGDLSPKTRKRKG